MASKKRGGLSKREYAAQMSGGSLNYKTGKVTQPKKYTVKSYGTPKTTTSVPSNAIGQNADGSFIYPKGATFSGPSLPGQVSPGFYDYSTQSEKPLTQAVRRNIASQAAKSRSSQKRYSSTPSSIPGLTGDVPAGITFGTPKPVDIESAISSGGLKKGGGLPVKEPSLLDRFLRNLGAGGTMSQGGAELANPLYTPGRDKVARTAGDLGADTAMAAFGTPLAANAPISDIGETPGMYSSDQPFTPANAIGQNADGSFIYANDVPPSAPFSSVGDTAQSAANRFESLFGQGSDVPASRVGDTRESAKKRFEDLFGGDTTTQDIQDTQDVLPADVPINDVPFPTQSNRSGRGSGLFGTGKGVGNPAGEDPYIKELRRSLKGFGSQEKSIKKQYEDLIKALDPTYQQYQSDIQKSVDDELRRNLLQLASVMNANNTGDSEQRAQLMSQQQASAASQLGDLIRKLMQQKQEDITGYKAKRDTAIGQVKDAKQSRRLEIAKLLKEAQANLTPYRTGSSTKSMGTKSSKITNNDIFEWTQDAINKGYNWGEIADAAKEQGIPVYTGGYFDKLMHKAFPQK